MNTTHAGHVAAMRAVRVVEAVERLTQARRAQREINASWAGKTTVEADEQREYARHTVRVAEFEMRRARGEA